MTLGLCCGGWPQGRPRRRASTVLQHPDVFAYAHMTTFMSCSMSRMVRSNSSRMCRMKCMSSVLSCGFIPAAGSSSRRKSAFSNSARAISEAALRPVGGSDAFFVDVGVEGEAVDERAGLFADRAFLAAGEAEDGRPPLALRRTRQPTARSPARIRCRRAGCSEGLGHARLADAVRGKPLHAALEEDVPFLRVCRSR